MKLKMRHAQPGSQQQQKTETDVPKLWRPYVPLETRCIVAVRQCAERDIDTSAVVNKPLARRLRHLLILLFAHRKHDLHHRPALENRTKLRSMMTKYGKSFEIIIYEPDANDPDHLVYLENNSENNEHYIETHVRGQGALRSDTATRMHQKAMDRNRGLLPRRPKAKIQSRGFSDQKIMLRTKQSWPKRKWPKRRFGSRS